MSRGAAVAQFRGNIAGAWRHTCRSTTENRRADTAIVLLMTELDASSGHNTEDHSASTIRLVRRQLPFLAILALAIGGWLTQTFRSGLSSAIGSSWPS